MIMKKINIVIYLVAGIVVFAVVIANLIYLFMILKINKETSLPLDEKLSNVKSDYALIIPSQAVAEYPLWSKDGKFVYALIEGSWKRLDLSKIHLSPGTWLDSMSIGVNDNPLSLEPA